MVNCSPLFTDAATFIGADGDDAVPPAGGVVTLRVAAGEVPYLFRAVIRNTNETPGLGFAKV